LRANIASLRPPVSDDDIGNRSRGFHRAGAELADRSADELHSRQGNARDGFARRVDVLTGLVPATGPTGPEYWNVFHGMDFGVARIVERYNQAVIKHGSFALLDRIQFDEEIAQRLHHKTCELARFRLVAEFGIDRLIVRDLVINLALPGDVS